MMREILEVVMLLSLLGGLFWVKHEFAKDKPAKLTTDESESR